MRWHGLVFLCDIMYMYVFSLNSKCLQLYVCLSVCLYVCICPIGNSRDFMPSRSHGLGSLPELRLHSDHPPLPLSGFSKRERERSPDLYLREPRMKPSNYSPNRDYYIPPPRPSSGYGPDVPPYRMSESFPSSGRKLFVKNVSHMYSTMYVCAWPYTVQVRKNVHVCTYVQCPTFGL